MHRRRYGQCMLTHLLYRLPVFWSIIYIYIYTVLPDGQLTKTPFHFIHVFSNSCANSTSRVVFVYSGNSFFMATSSCPICYFLLPVENLRRIGTGYSDLVRILSSDRCCLWAAVFNMKLQPPTRQCVCISDMWVKQSLLYLHDHTLKIHCRSLFR